MVASTPITGKAKDGLASNGKEGAKILPDAKLHATWDYEPKRHSDILATGRRGRMGSMSGITLSLGSRLQNENKVA